MNMMNKAEGLPWRFIILIAILVVVVFIFIPSVWKLKAGQTLDDLIPDFMRGEIPVKYDEEFTLENPYDISFHIDADEMDMEFFYNPNSKALVLGKKPVLSEIDKSNKKPSASQGNIEYQVSIDWWPDPTPLYYRYYDFQNINEWQWAPPSDEKLGRFDIYHWMRTSEEKVVRAAGSEYEGKSPVAENLEIIRNLERYNPDPSADAPNWRWRSHAGWISVDNRIIADIALKRKYQSIWSGDATEKEIIRKNKEFLKKFIGKSPEEGLNLIIGFVVGPGEFGFDDGGELNVYFFDKGGKKVKTLTYEATDRKLRDIDGLIDIFNQVTRGIGRRG